jgi:superfamily II DNA helicase RecQ
MNIREFNLEVSSSVVWTSEKLIMKLKNIHDYESKSRQLKIIMCVLNDRDCILSIKTKYEKNMILYSSSTLRMNTIILLIMSLNVLQNDQKNFILRMNSNIKSCVFNDEIIIKKLLNEIKYETYNHVLINSKLVLFNEFIKVVLQSSFFRERLVFVVIDEIHLMKNWSSWRFDYERFDELRNMLSRSMLFFAISTILKNQLIAQFVNNLRLNVDVMIIKKSLNRKNLFFSMQQIHHTSLINFENLRFLMFIFDVNTSLIKIIVYEDFINNLVQMKEAFVRFYTKVEATSSKANQAIRCYNEKMFEIEKFKIDENFMR